MLKKKTTTFSDRGIMTLSVIASLMSLPLVEKIHQSQMHWRRLCNLNYKGQYGGEVLIPLFIILASLIYITWRSDRRYRQYEKR